MIARFRNAIEIALVPDLPIPIAETLGNLLVVAIDELSTSQSFVS
jgi:hypothetical protein